MTSEVEHLSLQDVHRIDAEHDALAGPPHVASLLKPDMMSPSTVAISGHDGFLFIANGSRRWERQYLAEVVVTEAWLNDWQKIFAARQAEARARGVELWNLVVPEKQVLLAEKRWPTGGSQGGGRPFKLLEGVITPEARLLYPEAAMRAVQVTAPVFFRHDSHWTVSGCCAAADLVLEAMSAKARLKDVGVAVRREHRRHDLTDHFFAPPPTEDLLALAPAGQVVEDNRLFERTGEHVGNLYVVDNPAAPDPRRLVLFGDSCAFDMGLAYALSAVFSRVVFVWAKSVDWALVDQHRAELVLWESAERFIATHAQT